MTTANLSLTAAYQLVATGPADVTFEGSNGLWAVAASTPATGFRGHKIRSEATSIRLDTGENLYASGAGGFTHTNTAL